MVEKGLKNITAIFLLFFYINVPVISRGQSFTYKEWEDETIIDINKEPPSASFTAYPDEATAGNKETNPWVRPLNGNWKFFYTAQP